MATFGTESVGAAEHSERYIFGSLFTCPSAGVANTISCYLTNSTGAAINVKCAIYTSALPLLKGTEEISIPDGFANWQDFHFVGDPPLLAANYWLVRWAAADGCKIWKDAGGVNQFLYDSVAYNGWPDPVGPDAYLNENMSIHCDYTPSGGGVTVKKGNNPANTMTTMLNSKMLFSACNRFPKLSPRRL